MSQYYLQRFEYRGFIDKKTFDAVWEIGHKAMRKTGNWGNVKKGIKHHHAFGTAFGGYALIEVKDSAAFDEYQLFHTNNYAHIVTITFEPLVDLDKAVYSK